jgi:hypothetical protein
MIFRPASLRSDFGLGSLSTLAPRARQIAGKLLRHLIGKVTPEDRPRSAFYTA